MSLAVEAGRRRDRSRSRSRDSRPRDEPERVARSYKDAREPSYPDRESDMDAKYRRRDTASSRLPYPSEGALDSMLPGSDALYGYEDHREIRRATSPRPQTTNASQVPGSFPEEELSRTRGEGDDRRSKRRETKEARFDSHEGYQHPERGYTRRSELPRNKYEKRDSSDEKLKYLPPKYSRRYGTNDEASERGQYEHPDSNDESDEDLGYGALPPPSPRQSSPPTYGSYIPSSRSTDRRISKYEQYDDRDHRRRDPSPSSDDRHGRKSKKDIHKSQYEELARGSKPDVLTVEPTARTRDRSRIGRRDASPGSSALAVHSDKRDRDRSRDRRSSKRDSSPLPPTKRMSTLTVDTRQPSSMSLAAAPASPLLESYHGTYQSCSPMPSPLLLASQSSAEDPRMLESLSPLNSDIEGDGKKRSRRARFHDPEDIASRLARALKGDKPPNTEPLVDILPSLSHEQVMELRQEYKRLVKTGSERKGVNIAKHIRARLKDEDPLLMKACYSVALGMWESEAYWANFWYQGDKTRRELLIETLMGRTNEEIRLIKESFTDKKYDNSLTKCMKTELKEDKFKKAVLLVLDERRMEDIDSHGRRIPLEYELVDKDVDDLRRAVKAEKGGESLMISIVVQRSDMHLRAVLSDYERQHHGNFAREALKKSGNLVVCKTVFQNLLPKNTDPKR